MRLVWAVAKTGNNIEDTKEIRNGLSRNVVRILNGDGDGDGDGDGGSVLDTLLPWDIALLWWSLGELGVEFGLQLKVQPTLTKEQMNKLTPSASSMLVRTGVIDIFYIDSFMPSFYLFCNIYCCVRIPFYDTVCCSFGA